MKKSALGRKCGVSQSLLAAGATGVNAACHGNTAGVSSHNGHVIGNPRILLIFWDQYFTTTPAAVSTMSQFVSDLVTGPYMLGLNQYGVGMGSVVASVVINMANYPTPNSTSPGVPFSEDQMQAQLVGWLSVGVVTPSPVGNETDLVYLIFAPSDTTLSQGGNTSGFCGYHQHGKLNASGSDDNLFWATVQGYKKSGSGKAFVDSISYCVGHELVETFSNRDGQGVFTDDGHACEIGDLCEADTSGNIAKFPYLQWQVERYWSQRDGQCVLPTGPGYQLRVLDVGTDLGPTDPSQFVFLLAPNLDLYAIVMNGTGTGKTEVHVLTAASNYQSRGLETGIDLGPTDPSQVVFLLAPNLDLYAIVMNGTGTNTTEVHVFTAASNYHNRGLETGTSLGPTSPGQFVFRLASNLNLFAVMMNGTGTGKTEVHVLKP
jgi:hypothetical protein